MLKAGTSSLLACCLLAVTSRPLIGQAASPASQAAADLGKGEAALRSGDKAAAAEYFQSALKHDPNSAEAHANLGALAFFAGDCAAAEPNFRNALKESPGLAKVLALLSICERRRGEPSGIADMETAFGKLEDAKLRAQLGLELANAFYQKGDFEKTSSVLHALLEKDPDNVDLLFFAQRVYSELADTTLNKLAVLAPNSARMEQLIAERLINAGDLKDATAHYRTALNANPKLPGLHLELAESLMEDAPNKAETQAEARRELEAAIQVDGDSSKVECVLGRIALLQTDRAGAYSHYHRAYELNPSDVNAQMGLAEVLRLEDKPEAAATYLRAAIKVDPLNAEAHYKLSQVDRQLHLEEEQKRELQIFMDIRATRERVKRLFEEMNPPAASNGQSANGMKP